MSPECSAPNAWQASCLAGLKTTNAASQRCNACMRNDKLQAALTNYTQAANRQPAAAAGGIHRFRKHKHSTTVAFGRFVPSFPPQ